MTKITRETIVSTQELSNVIGISTRHINRLDDDGVFQKVTLGQYRLCPWVQTYIEKYVRHDDEKDKQVSYSDEKTLLAKA